MYSIHFFPAFYGMFCISSVKSPNLACLNLCYTLKKKDSLSVEPWIAKGVWLLGTFFDRKTMLQGSI